MIKNTDDILDIIKTRVNKDDLEFEALFNDKELLKNDKFQRVMEEINTYHAEILAQNEELRDKEKTLLQNEKELKTLFHDSPVPYIVLDDQFKVIKYNKAASTMLKIDKDRNFIVLSLFPSYGFYIS